MVKQFFTFLSFILFVLTGNLAVSCAQSLPQRSSLDVPAKLRELKRDGDKLVKAIVARDIRTILHYFPKGRVEVDFDYSLSRQQIEDQLRGRKGLVYAILLDTKQLQRLASEPTRSGSGLYSLHDYFIKAKVVTVEAWEDNVSLSNEPLSARLAIRWNGRPEKGIYDPIFIYTEDGWKFMTFFTRP